MVGNRPVVGVRNPVVLAYPYSYLRAKNAAGFCPEQQSTTFSFIYISSLRQKVSPVRPLEAAFQS
jgi:hypothetical protein